MDIVEIKSKEVCQTTGRIIGRLRQTSKISLETLAQRTGCTAGDLAEIENCTGDPSIRTLIKIAGAFGVDVLCLISGAGSSAPLATSCKPFEQGGATGRQGSVF